MSGPLQFTKPFYDYIVNETAHFVIGDFQQPSSAKEEAANTETLNATTKNLYNDVLKKAQEWANKEENRAKKKISDAQASQIVFKHVQEAARKYHFTNDPAKL